jgi:hypothetical protein
MRDVLWFGAVSLVDDPIADRIRAAVAAGFLVRTRADADNEDAVHQHRLSGRARGRRLRREHARRHAFAVQPAQRDARLHVEGDRRSGVRRRVIRPPALPTHSTCRYALPAHSAVEKSIRRRGHDLPEVRGANAPLRIH